MTKLFAVFAALVILTGCGGQDDVVVNEDQKMEGVVTYDCQGEIVVADFNNSVSPNTAQISFSDRDHAPIILTHVESASGAKYVAGNIIFWTQQNEATLSMDDMDSNLSCIASDESEADVM
jgi:membrane-bound inhibitor of C-type lysozyme